MDLDAAQLEELADSLVDSHDRLMQDLVAMRKRHGLTQDVVADRMGVSQPTVAAFERYDANPTLGSVRRYALAVGARIHHEVVDACCGFADEVFDAVVAQSGLATWSRVERKSWSWASGPVTIRTHVDA